MNDTVKKYIGEDTPAYNDEWKAKRRLCDALRTLNENLLTGSQEAATINALAEEIENKNTQFAESTRYCGKRAWVDSGEHGGIGNVHCELNPVSGASNPIAPPLAFSFSEDKAHASCYCGWAYEGPPGFVHGGYIAAIFDELLGRTQILAPKRGMTAYLNVDYRSPTPLNTNLTLEAWVEKTEGRKNFIRGEMRAGDTVTATCSALFVRPKYAD